MEGLIVLTPQIPKFPNFKSKNQFDIWGSVGKGGIEKRIDNFIYIKYIIINIYYNIY